MADNTRASWNPFLFEVQGKVQNTFPTEAVLLAELHGVDVSEGGTVQGVKRVTSDDVRNRDIFSGRQVRHTIVLSYLPNAGFVTESQTWNRPATLAAKEVQIKLVDIVQPFSVSVDVERDSFDHANASAVEGLMEQTKIAVARTENIALNGDGTGMIAICNTAAAQLTTNLSGTPNFDVLLPGTVWDVVTIATAAPVVGGKRRLIASVSESTPSVTFDTAQQSADGDSGNITFAAGTTAIAIPGSASTAATAGTLTAQGLEQAAAVTGTFESVDKATTPQWQGTDGRQGDTTVVPLSAQLLDKAVRRGRRAGLGTWDFGLGDPACIDVYKGGLYAQVRYEPQSAVLKSGYSGIVYDGADKPFPLVKEPVHAKGGIKLIDKDSFIMYGDKVGPSFLDDDGGMFRRFNPTLVKEADMLDRFQMGVVKCNTLVFLNNLAVS